MEKYSFRKCQADRSIDVEVGPTLTRVLHSQIHALYKFLHFFCIYFNLV